MLKSYREIFSPKLMVAIIVAAGFVFVPAFGQAGEKKQQKKVQVRSWNPEKKSAVKAKKKNCTAPKKDTAKNAARIELGDLPCDR